MSRPRRARPAAGDHGSLTLELAVLAPGLLALAGLLVVGGRIALADGAVQNAARDGARTASVARTAANAQGGARGAASGSLSAQGLHCRSTAVDVDTAGFTVPVGRPAAVSVSVACEVALSDVVLPGVPGTRLVTASVSSPLDTYRER